MDAALQLSIHYVEVFKGKAEELEMDLSQAAIHHYRTPFREDVIYTENASTKDNMTTVQDTALQGEVALAPRNWFYDLYTCRTKGTAATPMNCQPPGNEGLYFTKNFRYLEWRYLPM